ncbi:hypothetical protein NX059_012354 [Plenodomus lindquistii]|nr:hypothetical protein NX059_012354 [Plenodomus lindquistii]
MRKEGLAEDELLTKMGLIKQFIENEARQEMPRTEPSSAAYQEARAPWQSSIDEVNRKLEALIAAISGQLPTARADPFNRRTLSL